MKDINRVKQHLRRNHMRPPHCPTCWVTFKDEEIFYSHIGSRTCSPRLKVDLEGMTATQQKHLEERVDRKLSKSDQWYSVFSILFPDGPRPSSAYLDSNLSSQLLSFKQFMATDGFEIVEETAREHIPENLRGNSFGEEVIEFSKLLFQQAVPELLKRFEATRPHGTSDSGYGTSTDGPSSHHSIQDGHKVDAWKMQTILETNEQIPAEAEGCHADPMAASAWPDATCGDTGDYNLLNDDMGSLFDGIELGLGGDFGMLLG
ncbi:hypothetical protein SAMD00023353_0700160 [Rosellinia necatrix]|uniref:Uncharacterized protein n=1 Tax=Rosellinia necatrix TaxID=77044 RepID=A0A1S7ULM5_ROSNE|nr:hypothetical protein SAMD00023353_0700160 [Rosellinia necatrix]